MEESFDLYDQTGVALGRTKPRSQVHLDGDWHRSLHLWVLVDEGRAAGPRLVLQRRSQTKDTWPGSLDLSVTGHFRAGDNLAAALREAEEELGLPVRLEQTRRLGTRFRVEASRPPVVDREIQDILLVRTTFPFESLYPDPAELEAALALELKAASTLFGSAPDATVLARCLDARTRDLQDIPLRPSELVPARDGYYAIAWKHLLAAVEGIALPPFRLGPPTEATSLGSDATAARP